MNQGSKPHAESINDSRRTLSYSALEQRLGIDRGLIK